MKIDRGVIVVEIISLQDPAGKWHAVAMKDGVPFIQHGPFRTEAKADEFVAAMKERAQDLANKLWQREGL